jgi:hypothetical protein
MLIDRGIGEEILMIVGLPLQELRHSRAVQEILEEGRLEGRNEGREQGLEAGRQQEAAALAVRLRTHRLGNLDIASRERLSSLTLRQLEQLAEDLLDFSVPGHLQAWFVKFRAPTAPRQTAASQQPRVKKQPSVKSLRD